MNPTTAWLLLAAWLVSAAHGYRYIGCYVDSGQRDLPVLAGTGSMSATKCNGLCSTKKYRYFGLQYANECWCGNSYGRHGARSRSQCSMRCTGDHSAMCGASWRNSIYSTDIVTVKGQIQAAIRSHRSAFPGGVLCHNCLITGWSRKEIDTKSKVFPVSHLDSYMRSFPSKARSKVQVLKFGVNAKTTFEDFHFSVGHSQVERKSYIGVARRVGGNVELGMIAVDLRAPLVAKYSVHHKKTCKKILWVFKKCKTHTIRRRRGYNTNEVNLLDRALRSETFRLFAEKSHQLTV